MLCCVGALVSGQSPQLGLTSSSEDQTGVSRIALRQYGDLILFSFLVVSTDIGKDVTGSGC